MSTKPTTQLGDATIHRCSGGGFLGVGDVDLIVHQARGTHMQVGVREGTTTATARFKVEDLPKLLQSLIARSGRTDLTLHQTAPTNNVGHVKIDVSDDADPSVIDRVTRAHQAKPEKETAE